MPVRRRLTPRIACAALALCVPVAGWAETLADAVASAYDRNPQLVQQRYLQKTRDEGYVQARAQYGPTIDAETQIEHEYEKDGVRPAATGNGQISTVTISQPLYSSGRLRGNLEASKAAVLGGREELRLVEQQIVEDVVQVYAAVIRDQARLEVGRENVAVLEGQLRQNAKRQQVGDVTLTDVAQSDARVAAAQLQLASLEAQLTVSRGQYLEIVGHNPGDLEPLPLLAPLPPTIDAAFMQADDDNPSLAVAHYTERQSSATSAAVRGEQGPSVSIGAQASYQNQSKNRVLEFDRLTAVKRASVGVTISQPIWAGGAIQSRIREADARNLADQAGIDIARRQVMQQVTSSWADLSAARSEVVSGERQVASAQAAFAGMSCEELNGLRATIETLNAEQELQAAQLQLLSSRYEVYVSHAALLAATGNLTAQQIADGIHTYDPEANFKRVRFRGVTPLDFIAMAVDRIGSAGPRGPVSADLSGANAPRQDGVAPLAPSPGTALMNKPLTPITQSRLRLPNGDLARCPLNDIRPH